MTLAIHPLAEIFPPMSEEAFAGLVEDIRENGLREAIIVHEGKVLDGRNRYLACTKIGIEPITRPWDGRGDPIAFVVSRNLHRRHLTTSQRAMVGAKIATMKQGARTDLPQICAKSDEVAQDQAAKLMNVSRRSVQSARVVCDQGVPQLQQAVVAGVVSVAAAAEVAQQPEEEQMRIVAGGARAVAVAAKEHKQQRRWHMTLPDGMTPEQAARQALEFERRNPGVSAERAAKEIGLDKNNYTKLRDIILLADRTDLSADDRKDVKAAIADINGSHRVSPAHDALAPIIERIWGGTKARRTDKNAAKRVEAFLTSIDVAVYACLGIGEVDIPHISPEQAKKAISDIREAKRNLTRFEDRLRETCIK